MAKRNLLLEYSEELAVKIAKLCNEHKIDSNTVYQIKKSSSSVFANITEAQYPQSLADMLSKFEIARKECAETESWLKLIFASGAIDEETALYELEQFAAKWDSKYPKISVSWKAHWPELSTYFKYPQEVRRLIYTTNAIEGFNRQLRKVTKAKAVFPTDDSLLKMLYLAMLDIAKKWNGRRQDWAVIHAQLAVYYADRMPE